MPRLLLEGKSLTELLAKVREEHGPDVRIVAANRVRSGGIGGFFARESYAVTVDLDGDGRAAETPAFEEFFPPKAAAAAAAQSDAQTPGSLLDLAAAIDAAEAAEAGVVLGTAAMHASSPAPSAVATATSTAAATATATEAPTATAARRGPTLSTSSLGFTEVLARLATLDEPAPAPAPAPAPTTAPVAPGALQVDAEGWSKLQAVLSDVAPGIDLSAHTGALVLVVTPPPPAAVAVAPDPAPDVLIPRQGRHRRTH